MLEKSKRLMSLFIGIVCLSLGFQVAPVKAQHTSFVNPMIGTNKSDQFSMWGNYGGTYPGAVVPWGMVQLSPETSTRPAESGYYYDDSSILYFTCHSHNSGYPNGSCGRMKISFWPTQHVTAELQKKGRAFSHENEQAEAGFYRVMLDGNDQLELTTTPHNGFYRYHSKASQTTLLITDAGKIQWKDSCTLVGENKHTIIRFNRPIRRYAIQQDTVRIFFTQTDTQKGLELWLSFSKNSFLKSQENADAEVTQWDFDAIRRQAADRWEHELHVIQVEGKDNNEKTKFYTALYHAFLMPSIVSDVHDTLQRHEIYSPWDTFRSLHPMLSLLKPQRQLAMTRDIINRYVREGAIPKGPMTGFHMISILLDSWLKGTIQASPQLLLEMCEHHVQQYQNLPTVRAYLEKGYVDAQLELSVSITAELAYNDWLLSRLATLAGDTEKAASYEQRAYNYQHLLDATTGFMLPRKGNQFLRTAGELGYQESNRWTGSFFVPHNVQDLINRYGGDQRFASHLARAFDEGRILFDNEPVFHYPYLFTWASRPDLTTQYVHQILQKQYLNTPGGITGNDDLGSMSSWYVLSAIGLFPACPGSGEYLLSVPLFDRISFPVDQQNQQGQHTMTIRKKGVEKEGVTPTVWMNGKKLNRWFVTYQELKECRELVYDFTQPNTDLDKLDKPFSLTRSSFHFQLNATTNDCEMLSGEIRTLPFSVRNQGETGLFVAQLKEDNQVIAEKRLFIEKEEMVHDTLEFTCYAEGEHLLTFGHQTFTAKVKDAHAQAPFTCVQLNAPSLCHRADSLPIEVTIQNRSGRSRSGQLPILVNQIEQEQLKVSLAAGARKTYRVSLPKQSVGMKKISVLGKTQQIKVYNHPQEACILDLHYQQSPTTSATDYSGFGNHAQAFGNVVWGDKFVETNHQAYLSLPQSKSLMSPNQQVTLLTWIAPQEKPHGHADFFTKGDYCCFKMENARSLVFFIGGWGRGECNAKVPADWYQHWHLIAGVCTGPTLQIYIDGELKQEITVSGQLEANEAPWNVGRNAEIPYSRFWKARFSRTRIYGAALKATDIRQIFDQEKQEYR